MGRSGADRAEQRGLCLIALPLLGLFPRLYPSDQAYSQGKQDIALCTHLRRALTPHGFLDWQAQSHRGK